MNATFHKHVVSQTRYFINKDKVFIGTKELTNKKSDEQTKISSDKQKNILAIIKTNMQTEKQICR